MNLSIRAKRSVSRSLDIFGYLERRMRRLSSENVLILTYHRVLPPSANLEGIQSGMYVWTETFDRHLQYLKKYFTITPLAKLPRLLDGSSPPQVEKPHCCLTFDDGWRDFYDNAYPLLKKHHAPATVFLPIDFIDSNRQFWTDRFAKLLKQYLLQNDERRKKISAQVNDALVLKLLSFKGSFDARLEAGINLLKQCSNQTIEASLENLSMHLDMSVGQAERLFMTWVELKELAKTDIVSIGSHSCSHSIMTSLEEDRVVRELTISKEKLLSQGVVDHDFLPFCYPNGSYSEKITECVGSAGYHLAVSTRKGWNRVGCNPLTLSRISLHEDMTATDAMFGCKLLEIM